MARCLGRGGRRGQIRKENSDGEVTERIITRSASNTTHAHVIRVQSSNSSHCKKGEDSKHIGILHLEKPVTIEIDALNLSKVAEFKILEYSLYLVKM